MSKWPSISEIVFSPEDIEKRRNSIGGSDANIILGGDDDKIMKLWQFKTGKRPNDDLNNVLPVMMGHWTEDFNAQWYEKQTGDEVTKRNELYVHPDYPWRTANLDGVCLENTAVWEAKHVNQMSVIEDVINRYMPQLYHNADVYGVDKAVISIFKGTLDWVKFEIDIDKEYSEKVLEAEKDFWDCVKNDHPPFEIAEKIPNISMDDMREVDMSSSNRWVSLATDIIDTEDAHKNHTEYKKQIKELVESDVKKAYGSGITISRDKKGKLSLRINKENG